MTKKEINHRYYLKHKNKILKKHKIYSKKYYIKNKYKLSIQIKNYYQLNKQQIKERMKTYREEHKEDIKVYNKKYALTHKKERNTYLKKYLKNPINKLIWCYRHRINLALKGYTKGKSSEILLGCTIENLKIHLEKQFTTGMSWTNYGKWHVDHIRPCASFDLINAEEQRKCFNYTNLQPLWAVDNISKGNKT